MSKDAGESYDYVHDFDVPSSTTRFRFKSHKRHREEDNASDERRRSHRSSKRHRSEKHGSSRVNNSADAEEDIHPLPRERATSTASRSTSPIRGKDPSLPAHLDSEAAFRESLFDAMADDEGADYWSSIYGQPIHTYPNTYLSPETGRLEKMTDDEYTEFVRTKMWEKTHQHVLEGRARREAAAKALKEEREQARRNGEKMERDRDAFARRMEESLKRGEERRAEKRWKEAWKRYMERWKDILINHNQRESSSDRKIPWPIFSGQAKDVDEKGVAAFFQHAPDDQLGGKGLKDLLKKERIRWHPDKMQQRFGGSLDEKSMQSITAVFQLIDDLRAKTAR